MPTANITFLELDLASLASVKSAADTFTASSPRLDILLNNAGTMALPPSLTPDGYEIQFGTNHIGHALLTKLLLPNLERTAALPDTTPPDVRIINVSSDMHTFAPASGLALPAARTDMKAYSTWTRYGHSKLANILFTKSLAEKYPAIRSVTVHPGPVDTGLSLNFQRDHPWVAAVAGPVVLRMLKSVQHGALTQLFAATSEEAKSGAYYVPVAKESVPSKFARDPALAEELWAWTERELVAQGY